MQTLRNEPMQAPIPTTRTQSAACGISAPGPARPGRTRAPRPGRTGNPDLPGRPAVILEIAVAQEAGLEREDPAVRILGDPLVEEPERHLRLARLAVHDERADHVRIEIVGVELRDHVVEDVLQVVVSVLDLVV